MNLPALPTQCKALLGPSGAGKSTLMDILAQRKSVGTLTGQLLVSGRPVARGFIRKTAYVPQDDNFVPTMTTMETMRFYAAIILPDSMGRAGRQQRVEEVLSAVGLGTHHKTLVGGVLPGGLMLRGLSGGERKRLSIAVGILAAPSVVYLDEPTSGLDSFAALTVMGYMKRMARSNGQVVIASIHQPRSAIWSMFDTVRAAAAGGRGACGSPLLQLQRLSCGRGRAKVQAASSGQQFVVSSRHPPTLQLVTQIAPLNTPCLTPSPPLQVTLLASGRLMYYGPRDGLVEWFGARGYHYDAGMHGVASDWALDLVAIGFHKPKKFYGHTITTKEQLQSVSAAFVARYREAQGLKDSPADSPTHMGGSLGSKLRGAMRRSSAGGALSAASRSGAPPTTSSSSNSLASAAGPAGEEQLAPPATPLYATGWWSQYRACLGRELLAVTRNPADVAGRTLTFSWVALLMGLLYFNMPMDASSLRGRLNLLFNGLVFFCLMPYVSMSLYTADKKFYIADASAKLYRAHAYYAAKVGGGVAGGVILGRQSGCLVGLILT